MSRGYHYLFGPVPSRRLGRSLGVDLIPFKTCTLDCAYCQLGETTCEVSARGDYVPMQDVLLELEAWLAGGGRADHITLAGSGEPTLHRHFGDVFRWAREHSEIASVLLTNGTLLHDPEVRADAVLADKVKVTLSAWDEESFQRIHRPARGVTFDLLVQGERAFRRAFRGELAVEVFIVDGVNSSFSDAARVAEVVRSLEPDRVDLNTAVRPPADGSVRASSEGRLRALAELFGPGATVAASFKRRGFEAMELNEGAVVGLVRRHPATCVQLAGEFNLSADKMFQALGRLVSAGALATERRGAETYYVYRAQSV